MGILRAVFGPSKDEIWGQFAQQISGTFKEGGWLATPVVWAQHGPWVATLDNYRVSSGKSSQSFTRIRAPYVNESGFQFNVFSRSWPQSMYKLTGVPDIQIGDPLFDRRFIVQSSSEADVKRLLSNPETKVRLEADPDVHLSVKGDDGWFKQQFPQGVDELYFQTRGFVSDLGRLQRLFELFALVLDDLCAMGSAYDGPAGVRLG